MGKMNQKALSGGEYALMLGFVSLTLVAGFETISDQNQETLNKVKEKIDQITSSITDDEGSENILVGTLPAHLEPAVPPSDVSYLYNAEKAPTNFYFRSSGATYLRTEWMQYDMYGNEMDRLDLTPESSSPEQTYALGPTPDMECSGSQGDYCWMSISTNNVKDGGYNGGKIAVVGDKVGFTSMMHPIRDMVEQNTGVDFVYFENFANNMFFAPIIPGNWNSGWQISVRIDGNQNETYIINNSIERGRYMLEDGTFNVAYPFSDRDLYWTGSDMGNYEYIPSEGSIVNLYYAGTYDTDDKHLINMSTVSDWTSNCYSFEGYDIVKLVNPENNYSAVFNLHRTPTFSGAINSACNFSDANTFIQ